MSDRSISFAVEGPTDEAVAVRLLRELRLTPGTPYVTGGKNRLDVRLLAYNRAARFSPWMVLRDLDHDAECAPELRNMLLPDVAEHMQLRIVVRQVEAWLMADAKGLAGFLGIGEQRVPHEPDTLDNPKSTMVNLARQSSKRAVRIDMVPRPGLSVSTGPAYSSRLIEFAQTSWKPRHAARRSPSLRRCLGALSDWR